MIRKTFSSASGTITGTLSIQFFYNKLLINELNFFKKEKDFFHRKETTLKERILKLEEELKLCTFNAKLKHF